MIQDPEYVKKVHKALTDKVDGFNKSLEEFSASLNDDKYVSNVYKALSDKIDGFSKTPEQFKSLVSSPKPQKKNSNSTGTTPQKVSATKPQQKTTTSVGEKPVKTTPSGSSFGGSNNMYGGLNVLPPAPQPSSKKPKTLNEALGTPKTIEESIGQAKFDLNSKIKVPLLSQNELVNNLQKNRAKAKEEGLDSVVNESSTDFDDAVSGSGILNKAENFIRGSWNTAIAAASKLPLIGEEIASASNKMGIIADKNSVEKYFKQADDLFNKQGVKASEQDRYNKAKELKIEEDKRNYIENQDSKFLESIKNDEYLDPDTGVKTKVKDLLSLNDYNKYKTLDKETVDLSNKVKLNDLELQSIYKEIQQTKDVLNHQIIFGNFQGATDIYNKLKSKDGLTKDESSFVNYYEKNKEQAAKSPINPNLNETVAKLNQSLSDNSSKYNESLKQYYTSLEKYEKKYDDKVDVYEDFDNSKRSYDNVFLDKGIISAKETVNGVVKMVETLADLSSEIKTKYNLPAPGLDKYLFNKVFEGYNYYDFKNQIDKEKELIREDVKEVTDINSFVNYLSDVSSTQLGQMALPMMAGYGKIAMPLLRQSAVYFSSGFGRGVGESENYEERLSRGEVEPGEIGKVYSTWEKVLHGSLSGTADIIGNLPTAIRFSKGLNNVLQKPSTSSMFWKSFAKKGLEYGKETGIDLGKELGEETLAEWMQNASKVFVLQDPTAKLGDGTIDVLKDTTTFTGLMKVFPLFGKGIVNRISNSNESKLIQEKEKELGYWKNRVNEEGISEDTKKLYNDKALKIESELNSTYEKARKRIAEKPFLLKEVEDVNSQIEEKIKEGYSIKDNNELTDSEKTILLKEKELEYSKLNEKRDNILSDKYDPLSYLPEEESTKLKVQAAEELKAEAIKSGIEEGKVNIKEEEITKRAIDNYEKQSKETTVEKPTKEGPTGQENVQDVTATQGQQDKVVQEKNKVEELRGQEIAELKEQVENSEEFITDGKIDATKIAESDNAKAKEIYAKYDKLLKPLLAGVNDSKNLDVNMSDMSVDELEKRQFDIEESTNEKDRIEFNAIDKELESREWSSVLNSALSEVENIINNLLKKDKEMPNGFGTYIERADAIQTKAVARKYSSDVSKEESIKDFKDSFFGNPTTWYADGLKMRESVRSFIEKGGSFKELLQSVQKEFESDGFSEQDAANVINAKLESITNKNKPKKQKDAVQIESTSEVPVQSEATISEEVEQGKSEAKPEVATEQSKEEIVESIFDLDKESDLKDKGVLDKVINFLDKAEKELQDIQKSGVKGVLIPAPAVQVAIKAMKGALKTAKNIGELIEIGLNALKQTEWYKNLTPDVQSNIEAELPTSLSEYVFKNQQKKAQRDEVKAETSKLNKDRKAAIKNVKGGKFGSLTNTSKSNKETIVEHETKKVKVLNFAMLLPNIVKKAVTPELYENYSNALSALSGRGLAIDTKVTSQEVADLYDQIIDDYTNFSEIQNAVLNDDLSILNNNQNKFYNDNKDLFINPRDEKEVDEEDLAEKREELENEVISLIPSIKNTPKDYEAKSMSFKIASLLADINPFDLKLLSNSQLENLRRVLNTMSLGEDIPTFANDIYQEVLSNRNMALSSNIAEKYNKTGFNRIPLRRTLTKMSDAIRGFFGENSLTKESNIKSRAARYPLVLIDTANKIFGILPTYADAIMNNYKAIPIYNYILSAIEKGEGALASRNEEVAEVFEKVNEKLSKNTKDIDESYRKIHFAFLQIQAWANPGNKKVKNGIVSFTQNFESSDSPYSDKMKSQYREFVNKYKGYSFIKSDDNIIVLDNNGVDVTTEYFSREEMNAYKAIRKELDNQKARAEETSLFNNKNALPFVNEYFPENNFSKKASAQSINEDPLSNNFSNNPSVKSKNLLEKTAVAHPVAHNPFAVSLISIKGTEMQYQLLNPIQVARKTMKKIIEDNNKAILESTGKEKSKYNELAKVYDNIDSAIETLVEHLKGANIGKPDALDNISDLLTNTFYVGALASGIRTVADLSLNYQHLITAEPSAVQTGFKERVNIKNAVNKVDSKDPDKVYRQILKYIDASQINRLMGVVNLTSVRSEFQSEGANPDITRKGVESDASKVFKKVIGIASPLTKSAKTINETLMSVSDNMPALNFFIGVFSNEFKQASGKDFDWEKAAENSSEYALENSDAMNHASTIANYKLATYLGSKNVSSKSPAVVSSMRGQDGKILSKLKNRANYMFRQFTMSSTGQFLGALNTLFEVESAKDVSKQVRIMVGSGLRTSLYFAVSQSIINGIAGLILGDDEDEDVMKKNSDELSNDDEFIKNLYTIKENYAKFEEDVKKLDPESEFDIAEVFGTDGKLKQDILDLLKDKRFRELFDANYRFYAREMFSLKINTLAKDNGLMKSYDEGDVKGIINRIDSGNKNISQFQLEMHLAYLNSEYGRSAISQEDRENYIEKIEEYLVNTKYYLLYNKVTSSDEFDETTPEGVFKTSALYITIDNLLKHRDNSFESNFEKGVVETGVNLVTGVRGTFPQKGVSYVVELINRKHKESTRGYYDFEKDRYNYATPDIMLSDKDVDLGKITESLTPPEITVLLRAFQRNKETDAALIAFRLPGISDINRISGGIKKDEIYQNARGKFVENEIKKFLERKLYLTEEEKEEKAKKEAEYNSKLVQDKNKVRRVTK